MNAGCERFDRWLDEGRADAEAAWADEHARACARCRSALALEDALAMPVEVATGAAFTERVLFRVRDAERGLAAARVPLDDSTGAWWLSAPAEPAAALALAVAALLVWKADVLWAWGLSLGVRVGAFHLPALAALERLLPAWHVPGGETGQALLLAMLATLAPLAWLASMSLYGWVQRHVMPRARHA